MDQFVGHEAAPGADIDELDPHDILKIREFEAESQSDDVDLREFLRRGAEAIRVLAGRPPAGRPDDLGAAFARLYRERETLRAEVEELALVREVALSVLANLEPARAYAAALEAVSTAVGTRAVTLWMDEEGTLVAAASGDEAAAAAPSLEVLLAARERRPVSVADEEGLRSAVPLVARGECLGVLEARGVEGGAIETLRALAAPIAVAAANARLYEMAVADGLTGLYVARHFRRRLREEIDRAHRYRRPVALVLIDIDHFKAVNDTHGHLTGDRVLKGVAAILRRHARAADLPARYGGEELAILLPETDLEGARRLAERVRSAVEAARFRDDAGGEVRVTISAGAAVAPPAREPDALVAAADAGLYRAKRAGRNRVEVETAIEAAAS